MAEVEYCSAERKDGIFLGSLGVYFEKIGSSEGV